MNKLIYFTLFIVALTACGRSDQVTEREEHKKLVNQLNDKIISELSDKYSIEYSIDTLQYDYTVQHEDLLKADYQMIDLFRIQDIYNEDGISFVKIEAGMRSVYYLNLRIPETEQQKLLTLDRSYYRPAKAVMIVKLQEIKKIDLTLETYPEDQNYWSIEFESSSSFLGKGHVIEVQILNK